MAKSENWIKEEGKALAKEMQGEDMMIYQDFRERATIKGGRIYKHAFEWSFVFFNTEDGKKYKVYVKKEGEANIYIDSEKVYIGNINEMNFEDYTQRK